MSTLEFDQMVENYRAEINHLSKAQIIEAFQHEMERRRKQWKQEDQETDEINRKSFATRVARLP